MLSIEASKNADAAHKYFRDHLLAGDYYTEKKSIPGYWHGKTAKMLGLEGEVKARDFEALLFNVDPRSGDRLTARNVSNRRPMYDATFSAPKSVSILYSILQDQDVLIAHRTAVQKAMAAMESDIQTQTGNGKAKRYETTGNLVYAEFVHETSRPLKQKDNKQYIPDPQLHSHATVINATWFVKEGRFRAVEMGTVKGQSSYYESLYHSFLGHEMRKLGFELEKEGKRWEVKNIDKTIRDKFSGRTLEIEAIAEKRGIKSAKAKAQLGRLTRHSKDKSVDDRELPEIWKGRLTESEYQKVLSAKGAYYSDDKGKGDKGSPMTAERALDLAFEHVFERQSAIQEKRLLAHAIDLASGQVLPETIHEELKSRKNIIAANRNGVKYVSTREMLREEERMIERASSGKATCPQLNPGYEFKNDLLNDGQKAAIKHVLESRDKIMIVSGDAGVGKTTLMQEVRQGVEESGKRLFAFAPTAEASRVQLQGKGFEEADTISRLLASPELQAKLKNQVILIDEAGLVSVRAMNQLIDIVDQTGSRMILSGDYKQHSSVEAGDAQRLLEHQAGLPVARVNEIIRQNANEPYKRVIESVASGIGLKNDPEKRKFEIAQAYDRLDDNGHIIAVPDIAERHKLIANEYLEGSKKSPKDVIVVSPTHGEGREITKAIRERLKEEGRIGVEDREFERLSNLHLTGSEKQIATNYSPGQIVEFHQNVKGFRAGSRFEVAGRDEQGNVMVKAENQVAPVILPINQFKDFQVFNKETINFTQQDQLKITKNSKSIEGSNLFNGQTYEIKGFTDDGHIKLSNGQTLDRKSMHFDTSYYQTSYSAQGRDAKTVLVAQSSQSLAASNDKQFYVTISRGTENLKIYTDDKDSLREAVSRSGDRISAGEIAKQAQVVRPDKAKEAEYMSNIRMFYDQKIKPAFERIKSDYERGTPNRQMERPSRSLEA